MCWGFLSFFLFLVLVLLSVLNLKGSKKGKIYLKSLLHDTEANGERKSVQQQAAVMLHQPKQLPATANAVPTLKPRSTLLLIYPRF